MRREDRHARPAGPAFDKSAPQDRLGKRTGPCALDQECHAHVLIAKSQGLKLERIKRFEIEIVVDESVNIDLDNNCKSLIDFLRRINLIYDDNPKCMRKLTMTWGAAPAGIKIIVTPLAGEVSSSDILSTLRGKIRPMNIPKLEKEP